MTELQMGLIGLGGAAVVAVLGYNKWQELRQRKLAEQLLKANHCDVLLDAADAGASGRLAEAGGLGDPGDFEPVLADDAPPEFASSREPVAPFGERIEPSFGGDPSPRIDPSFAPLPSAPLAADAQSPSPAVHQAASDKPAATSDEPLVPARRSVAETQVAPRALDELKEIAEPLHLLSPQVDYIAAFDAVEAVPAPHIVAAQRAALARIHKAVHWIAYNEQAREWEPIAGDGAGEYRHFRAGLQLVDRRGPLSDADLSQFHVAMQDEADQLAAIVDLPARRMVLESAAQLDGFCAGVDIQIGINVVAQAQAFAGTKLRALAEAAGMVIDGDGRFVRCDDDGNVLYLLLNQEATGFSVEAMKTMATQGVTFLLDVPRVAHGERVFNQMVELARRFADVLRGALVDDNRRPLSEGALEPIRRQVAEYQSLMAAQGLPAGSPLTQRLFS